MAERKFTRGLSKPGSAAQVRETVSQVVRQSTVLAKPQLVEPIDYETFVAKNKTRLFNDPHREMLLFPNDDVSQATLPRRCRTVVPTCPTTSHSEITNRFVLECIKSYAASWNLVHFKYSAYSGSYLQLPNLSSRIPKPENLEEQVYEVDAVTEQNEVENLRNLEITKQGYLLKGPESGNETFIASIATKSFKRRYVFLRGDVDGSYYLEFHKDDKKSEPKFAICLDYCNDVVRNSKRGKFSFDLKMKEGYKSYVLAAENESELEEWIDTIKQIIHNAKQEEKEYKVTSERGESPLTTPDLHQGTLRSLEHSRHPELMKYAKETGASIAAARKENRQNLFAIYSEMPKTPELIQDTEEFDAEPYKEQFGSRFFVHCESIKFDLQVPSEMDHGSLCQVEPYFTTMSLFDVKNGKKISEDFRFDVNNPSVRGMLPKSRHRTESRQSNGTVESSNGCGNDRKEQTSKILPSVLAGLSEDWLACPRQAIFNVSHPDPEIYLVIRIEKVLQGAISQAVEPYLRVARIGDFRTACKVNKIARACCLRLGHYRMPFAWTAKPVFRAYNGHMQLDTTQDITTIYRQEASRLSDEDLLKHLTEWRKPDKKHRLTAMPGSLRIVLEPLQNSVTNCLTSSLVPLRPFPVPPTHNPTIEIDEFPSEKAEDSYPYISYVNHLYIFPKCLQFETQKMFMKARNIACIVEVREKDTEDALPLQCIYGRPGETLLTCQARCAVTHHSTTPYFYEEVKIELPAQLHDKHHLLFTFLHVSCEPPKGNKRKDQPVETAVGYAWLPILQDGRIIVEEQVLPVASHLPSGYLACKPLGLGKGYSGPEIRWVEGQKPLFKFESKLNSTIYTKDKHLHNFFAHVQKLSESKIPSSDNETSKNIKGQLLKRSEVCSWPSLRPFPDQTTDFQESDGACGIIGNNRASTGSELGKEITTYIKVTHQVSKALKAMHAIDCSALISFLPTILNQLFSLLVNNVCESVALDVVRVIIHIVNTVYEVGKTEILHSYVKYVFLTEPLNTGRKTTVHEELTTSLIKTLRPANTDFLVINKFLRHSWFFFQILAKSMAQHLLNTQRIKMYRHERFSSDYQFRIQNLLQGLMPHIRQKFKELPDETRQANRSLAYFIKKCLTFMDRGFVFKLISVYVDKFDLGDTKVLQEYKFEFLQIVLSHEHYISLNLPLMRGGSRRGSQRNIKDEADAEPDLEHEYRLSEEFCRNHFLVGVLLQEVKLALNEVRDVRKIAVSVLRNLLAKHAFDDRYQSRGQQARIASLYLPFITIILENLNRLNCPESSAATVTSSVKTSNGSTNLSKSSGSQTACNSTTALTAVATPLTSQRLLMHRLTIGPGTVSPLLHHDDKQHKRDSSYFSMISGQASMLSSAVSSSSLNSSSSTLSAGSQPETAKESSISTDGKSKVESSHGHSRSQSLFTTVRYDKLTPTEVKDLLICFLYIIKNVNEELLIGWWQQCFECDLLDFFHVLEICLHHFRYLGRKQIVSSSKSQNQTAVGPKSMTLPARMVPPNFANSGSRTLSSCSETASMEAAIDADIRHRALLEANVATEIGLITLDVLGLYCLHFKEQLLENDGDNSIMRKVFDIYMFFLQVGQSEKLLQHVFAALRAFIIQFPVALFQGSAVLCGKFCYEILKCCISHLATTRNAACAILYLLMRGNYEFTNGNGITRVHLQVIISVSQLLGEVTGLNCDRFQESLYIINKYAHSDKAMQANSFPNEVKDLTKRIRTVLMATMQMREHEGDPEMLIDLQHSLANSYAATPELRRTWLESMAKNHLRNGDLSEAAFCNIHIAALIAEYLKQKDIFQNGCKAFVSISPSIYHDESLIKNDTGMQDTHYSEETLLERMKDCADLLDRAERYELICDIYKIIIPIYEQHRDYESLANCYKHLHGAYAKIVDVNKSGKRLLGKFYRVAFFGQAFFEEEDGKEYIYKEPKVTSLPEISERLYRLFCEKFKKDNVKMIMDSVTVDPKDLDPRFAYIQVTHVTPYFEAKELKMRVTEFERNNNISRFLFETPFTLGGKKARGTPEEQCKRKTILKTIYSFPYVKKRIAVFSKNVIELSPIEVAIEEMETRVNELIEVINLQSPDLKKLQLKLQGSISVQVNAGPMAYASAFLDDKNIAKYACDKVNELKQVYRNFIRVCAKALELNKKLIVADQHEYHEAMKQNFHELVNELSELMHEKLFYEDKLSSPGRNSLIFFNYISATPGSSTA